MATAKKGLSKEIQALLSKVKVRKVGDRKSIAYDDYVDYFDVVGTHLYEPPDAKPYVRCDHADGSYSFLGVGKSVKLAKRGDARLDYLIDNYILYCGDTDKDEKTRDNSWFSFGAENGRDEYLTASRTTGRKADEETDEEDDDEPAPKRRRAVA